MAIVSEGSTVGIRYVAQQWVSHLVGHKGGSEIHLEWCVDRAEESAAISRRTCIVVDRFLGEPGTH